MKITINGDNLIEVLGPVKVDAEGNLSLGKNSAGRWVKVYVVEVVPDFESDVAPQIVKEILDGSDDWKR